jgi:hypothetical protein
MTLARHHQDSSLKLCGACLGEGDDSRTPARAKPEPQLHTRFRAVKFNHMESPISGGS